MVSRNFCQKSVRVNFFNYHTVRENFREINSCHRRSTVLWKLWKFSLTLFWQKFRETNSFTKEITKLIWRNIFSVRVNFSFSTPWFTNCSDKPKVNHLFPNAKWFDENFVKIAIIIPLSLILNYLSLKFTKHFFTKVKVTFFKSIKNLQFHGIYLFSKEASKIIPCH